MEKKADRKNQIIKVTTALLVKEGAETLSMRKVAKESGISLSNLQYYYSSKDALLIATVELYFIGCQEEIIEKLVPLNLKKALQNEQFFKDLLALLLYNGRAHHQTIMFKEIAALASRNKELDSALDKYYSEYCQWMVQLVSTYTNHSEIVTSILVPYLQGYSSMNSIVPSSKEDIINVLVTWILNLKS